MAVTTCPKCRSGSFELQAAKVKDLASGHYFLQCANCGTPVAILEQANKTVTHEETTAALSSNFADVHRELETIKIQLAELKNLILLRRT
jgi:hypothetical protein